MKANNLDDFVVKVLTLNCWGLWLGAQRRRQRIKAIVRYILDNNCDIVFLQEVWVNSDFELIRNETKDIYRFAHLYKSGSVLGSSGIVILSRWAPKVVHFEPYSLNGSPFCPWHGDWFAGKGIAYARVDFDKLSLHLFSTHTHAYYKENEPVHDQYSVHRICQSYQLARFINFIGDTTANRRANEKDLLIVAGDMNCTSSELPYRLLTSLGTLKDCFKMPRHFLSVPSKHQTTELAGASSETDEEDITYYHPRNSFTPSNFKKRTEKCPKKRIDFILCRLLTHGHYMVERVTSQSVDQTIDCSLSDHEPVMVELTITDQVDESNGDNNNASNQSEQFNMKVLEEAQNILLQYYQYNQTSKTQLFYVVLLMFMITLPSTTYYATTNELMPISALILMWFASTFLFAIGLLMCFLSYRYEQGAIEAILNNIHMKVVDKSHSPFHSQLMIEE